MGKWEGIVGRSFIPEEFREYVAGLNSDAWRPEFIVLHHTAVPSLGQRPSGFTREHLLGLEKYYRDEMGWSAGPHLFVDDHMIWVFTPLTVPGVHAKSFNAHSLGVEMLGNYDREDFYSGRGLAVQQNAVAAIAILSEVLEIDPESMMCHRDEPNTSKTCPGNNVDKADFIRAVKDYTSGKPFAGRLPIFQAEPEEPAPQLAPQTVLEAEPGPPEPSLPAEASGFWAVLIRILRWGWR